MPIVLILLYLNGQIEIFYACSLVSEDGNMIKWMFDTFNQHNEYDRDNHFFLTKNIVLLIQKMAFVVTVHWVIYTQNFDISASIWLKWYLFSKH